MKVHYLRIFILLSVILACFPIVAQNYKWTDELELLRRVDLLPVYRTNYIVEQISSYDKSGGNDDGFNGTYSYIRKENGKLVLADLKGPGVINRIWTPTPTNDTISFYFDGETRPRITIRFSELFSNTKYPFLKPVCGDAVGGYYCYIPIPYNKSCKILFHGPKIKFHQIQYRNLPGVNVESYTGNFTSEDNDHLSQVRNLWSNTYQSVNYFTEGLSSNIQTSEKTFTLNPGEEFSFYDSNVPGRIVGFEIDGGTSFEGLYKDVILSASWDGESVEAIYSPLADFFGYAYGSGSMKSMLIGKRTNVNYCYLPMPYDRSAKLKLIYKIRENVTQHPIVVKTKVFYNSNARDSMDEGKFYSVWRREINPPFGKDYKFLKIQGKGHYIGTMLLAQGLRRGVTLFFEGDDSTYVDGKMRLHGTGSEDYFNGGWYNISGGWDKAYSLAIHGCLDYNASKFRTGGFRFYLSDKMSFENEIYQGIEHGPQGNEFPVDYTSVAYFYCNQPLAKRMEPTTPLREVYIPTEPFLRSDFREFDSKMKPQHGDIAVGDIDDDGDLDLIIGGEQRYSPFLYQGGTFINDGKGNFSRKADSPVTVGKMGTMDFGDIDGDGDLDLIFNGSNNTGTIFSKGIALNDGKGNFTMGSSLKYPTPPQYSTSCFFADFNNDGRLDYCHSGSGTDSYMAIYFQQEDGSFEEDVRSFAKYKFVNETVQAIDYNNDGYLDIFVMGWLDSAVDDIKKGQFTGLFKNDGNGKFNYDPQPFLKMKGYGSADWADLDGNGWLDFIMHGEGNNSPETNDWLHRIYKNKDGVFTQAFQYQRCRQFSIGGADILQDFDNDGDVDVLFGGWCDQLQPSARQKTFVYQNNDDDNDMSSEDLTENYFLSNQYLPGMSEQDFEVADMDGDFRLDYIYQGFDEGYSDNPVHLNRVICGWSPCPDDKGFVVSPYVKLAAPVHLKTSINGAGLDRKVTFSWDEPVNNGGRKSTTYNIAIRDSRTGKWLYNPMAIIGGDKDGWRKVNRLGNVFLNKRWSLRLPDGSYEWTVQAIDAARFGGNFAPMQMLDISTDINKMSSFNPTVLGSKNVFSIKNGNNEILKLKVYTLTGMKILDTLFSTEYNAPIQSGIYLLEMNSSTNHYRAKVLVE